VRTLQEQVQRLEAVIEVYRKRLSVTAQNMQRIQALSAETQEQPPVIADDSILCKRGTATYVMLYSRRFRRCRMLKDH